jgi:protein-tyrosine phosphatase
VPVWEEVLPENVAVLKDIMESRNHADSMTLQYNRIPITAEKPPDFTDLSELIEVVMRTSMNTPIVVNCQLGGGRSTLASILLVLIRQWLETAPAITPNLASGRNMHWPMSMAMSESIGFPHRPKPRKSYQVINST